MPWSCWERPSQQPRKVVSLCLRSGGSCFVVISGFVSLCLHSTGSCFVMISRFVSLCLPSTGSCFVMISRFVSLCLALSPFYWIPLRAGNMAAWSPGKARGQDMAVSPCRRQFFVDCTVLAQEQRFPDPILQHRVRPLLARGERPTMKQMIEKRLRQSSTQTRKQLETKAPRNPTLLTHPGPAAQLKRRLACFEAMRKGLRCLRERWRMADRKH